jgi:hypothetical protein
MDRVVVPWHRLVADVVVGVVDHDHTKNGDLQAVLANIS